jgi:hypothetical protein
VRSIKGVILSLGAFEKLKAIDKNNRCPPPPTFSWVIGPVRMALPREARQSNKFNALRNCLGKKRLIVFQGVLDRPPKLEREEASVHRGCASLPFQGDGHASKLSWAAQWSDFRARHGESNAGPWTDSNRGLAPISNCWFRRPLECCHSEGGGHMFESYRDQREPVSP